MHTKNVIKLSQAWIAAFFLGLLLSGCGGGSDSQDADTQSVDRSATLSWSAPQSRADGTTSLGPGALKSYIISYGQGSEDLKVIQLEVEEGHQHPPLEYTFEDLPDGEWHFSVQAEDQNGLMSPPSEVVSKTI